jgi:hypothetical protein
VPAQTVLHVVSARIIVHSHVLSVMNARESVPGILIVTAVKILTVKSAVQPHFVPTAVRVITVFCWLTVESASSVVSIPAIAQDATNYVGHRGAGVPNSFVIFVRFAALVQGI